MNRNYILVFIALLLLSSPFVLRAQNPAAYYHVSNWSNYAEFTIQKSARAVVKQKNVTFEVQKETKMTFHVLVMPDGKVRYVRPPRYSPEIAEYRLGGADALYSFRFEESDPAAGDEWIAIDMLVKPESVSLQAQ